MSVFALQFTQLREMFDAFQVENFQRADIYSCDLRPLCQTEHSISIRVYFFMRSRVLIIIRCSFEVLSEIFIREVGFIDWHISCYRKGAEGQKGEHHSQRQKGTDKARSF